MFSLRVTAVVLLLSTFALFSAHDAGAWRSHQDSDDTVVGLAVGVMGALGAAPSAERSVEANLGVDARTGQAIYLPTGEVIDEVIPVRATPVQPTIAPNRHAAALETSPAGMCDGGMELPVQRDASTPSAT